VNVSVLGQSPSLLNAYLAIIAGTQFVPHRLHQSPKLGHLIQERLDLTRLLLILLLQVVDDGNQLVVRVLTLVLPLPELLQSLLVEVQSVANLIMGSVDVDEGILHFLLEDRMFGL